MLNLDMRWRRQIRRIYTFEHKRKEYFDLKKYLEENNSYKTQINIYYDPSHMHDRRHAERLGNTNNVILHPIKEGRHAVVKAMRDNGQLKSLLKSAFE